jgi:ferredoxin
MKVKFLPMNVELEVKPYQSVMDLAHKNGIKIKSVCNGMPSCAECRVQLVEGDANVLPPSVKELSLIGTGHFIDQRRLSCQLVCFGDIVVDLHEQIEKAESDTKRKPQGNMRGAEQSMESKAVTGNLIEQDDDIKQFIGQFKDSDANDNAEGAPVKQPRRETRNENRNNHRNDRNDNRGGSRNENRADNRQGGREGGKDGGRDNNRNHGRNNDRHRSGNRDQQARGPEAREQSRDNQARENQQRGNQSRDNANRPENRVVQNDNRGGGNNGPNNSPNSPNPRKPFKFRPQ